MFKTIDSITFKSNKFKLNVKNVWDLIVLYNENE